MLSYPLKCILGLVLCKFVGALWFYEVILRLPRFSLAAALAAVPMLCLNVAIGLMWDGDRCPVLVVAHGVAVMGWVSNSKVIAYLCGRGPSYSRAMSFREVFAGVALPASIAHPTHDDYAAAKKTDGVAQAAKASQNGSSSSSSKNNSMVVEETWSPLSYVRSQLGIVAIYGALLAASGSAILHSSTLRLPIWAVQALYGIAFMAFVPLPLTGYGTLAALLARRAAAPSTVSPWAPQSVSDFWGVRWNRFTGDVLRWTVYEPLASGAWRLAPGTDQRALLRAAPAWRRVLAAAATFLVSGLFHDLIWLAITGMPLVLCTPFFLANAVVVVVEGLVRQRLFARSSLRGGKPGTPSNGISVTVTCDAAGKQTANGGVGGSKGRLRGLSSADRLLLALLWPLRAQAVRTVVVFTVVMGLGGWLAWPRLAVAIGEKYGLPCSTFEELHVLAMAQS